MKKEKFKSKEEEHLWEIRQAYIELVDYLKIIMFQQGILERPSYMELSTKLGFNYNWIKDKKDTLKAHFPLKKTFDDFFIRLIAKNIDLLNGSWNAIENKFQNLYNIAFSTEANLPSSPSVFKKSIKRQFFDDIKEIIRYNFPNARIFDTDLSRIFFSRARALKDTHIKGSTKFRRFDESTLFAMIYRIRIITNQDFVRRIRDIKTVDQMTLNSIKRDIERYIEDFIFSNPFNSKYVNDKHDIGTKYFKPEYDLTLNLWFVLSKTKKTPILLKHAQKMLKFDTFGKFRRGWEYSWDGIMNMLKELVKLLPSEEYSKAFEKAWKYVEIRNLYPALPRVYHSSWYTKNTIKYHVLMLIIRDLGLDILNLDRIKPEAFNKTQFMDSYTFERHHIYINDKYSIDVNRLVLVMHMYHNDLEGKTDLVLELVKRRIDLTLECPQYYKTNLKEWKTKWQEYLERRNYLIENGIENFIVNYFTDEQGNNYVLNRFFNNVPKGHIEQEIRSMMQDWINKGRPAPILNTHILNRLFLGTSQLLNSGYSPNI